MITRGYGITGSGTTPGETVWYEGVTAQLAGGIEAVLDDAGYMVRIEDEEEAMKDGDIQVTIDDGYEVERSCE